MRAALFALALLPACTGLALDTTVAETEGTRAAMVASVRIGETTEGGMTLRWGNPFQKVREGAQTEYIYRRLNGTDFEYVIVTFRHGVATDVRTSADEGCRGSFAPRLPGYGFETPEVVWPVGPRCGPDAAEARTGAIQVRGRNGLFGTGLFPTQPDAGDARPDGVPQDRYTGDRKLK